MPVGHIHDWSHIEGNTPARVACMDTEPAARTTLYTLTHLSEMLSADNIEDREDAREMVSLLHQLSPKERRAIYCNIISPCLSRREIEAQAPLLRSIVHKLEVMQNAD